METDNAASRSVVLSLGSIAADFQLRIPHFIEESATMLASRFTRAGGGKAANVAICASRLNTRSRLFGCVGDDDLAQQALEPLRRAEVELDGVRRDSGQATAAAFVLVPPSGKKAIVQAPNANAHWSEAEAQDMVRAIAACQDDAVLVVDCEVPERVIVAALRAAGEKGFLRLLDPSPADAVTDRILSEVDIVTPNPAEAHALTGAKVKDQWSALEAAQELSRKGPTIVAVKQPFGGCVLWTDDTAFNVRGAAVEPIDTTGAGDAFAGTMAVALLERKSAVEAARRATAAADHAVTVWGAQAGLPDTVRLEKALAKVTAEPL